MRSITTLLLTMFMVTVTAGCGRTDQSAATDYCRLIQECEPAMALSDQDVEECSQDVVDELEWIDEMAPPRCSEAIRDLVYCISALDSCSDWDDYWMEPTPDYPCHREDEAVWRRC